MRRCRSRRISRRAPSADRARPRGGPATRAARQARASAVRAHVDALSKQGATGPGCPPARNSSVCFVPSESLLAAALEEDPALLDHALRASGSPWPHPVNLVGGAQDPVAFTWTQQDVSAEAAHTLRSGQPALRALSASSPRHADDLRRAIERTVDSYNRLRRLAGVARAGAARARFPGIDQTKLDAVARPGGHRQSTAAADRRPNSSTQTLRLHHGGALTPRHRTTRCARRSRLDHGPTSATYARGAATRHA